MLQPTRSLIPASTDLPWQGKELDVIRQLIAPNLTPEELYVFGKVCRHTRLDPFAKQIYAIKRSGKMTIQTSIDGYRVIAARTHQLAGTDKPRYYYDDKGALVEAEVTIYRMIGGQRCAFTASAFMAEYRPAPGQDHMWQKMPHRMLAKCAEALALRMAFPAELSGLYTAEEMDQAGLPDAAALMSEAQEPPAASVAIEAEMVEAAPVQPAKATPANRVPKVGDQCVMLAQDLHYDRVAWDGVVANHTSNGKTDWDAVKAQLMKEAEERTRAQKQAVSV